MPIPSDANVPEVSTPFATEQINTECEEQVDEHHTILFVAFGTLCSS